MAVFTSSSLIIAAAFGTTFLVALVAILKKSPKLFGSLLDLTRNTVKVNGKLISSTKEPDFPWGNILQRLKDPEEHIKIQTEASKKQGGFSLVWGFSKPSVMFHDLKHAKTLFAADITIRKTTRRMKDGLPVWKMLFGDGLFMIGPEKWKRQHKICVRGMGSRHLKNYYPAVVSCVNKASNSLAKILGNAREVKMNVGPLFQSYTTEAIMRIGFGESLSQKDVERLGKVFCEVMEAGTSPMYLFRAYLHSPLPGPRKLRRDIAELHAVCGEIVRRCRNEEKLASHATNTESGDIETKAKSANGSLLKALVKASDANGDQFTERECVHNVYSFVGAGIDTTSTALMHMATVLAERPEFQSKAREEVFDVLAGRQYGDLSVDEILSGFPYLSAFVKEVMRLYPSVSGPPARFTTRETSIGPMTVGPGALMVCPSYIVHRNENWWGKDAAVFRPERFLESKEGRTSGDGVDVAHTMGKCGDVALQQRGELLVRQCLTCFLSQGGDL